MIKSPSWWARIGGSASRRSKVVFAALTLFLASSVFILQPDWHVPSSGLRVPDLHHQPSSGPSTSPPTENSLRPQKNAGDNGYSPRTAILSPDADGVLLSAGTPVFTSPSGRYSLILQDDGDLVLSRMEEDGTAHPVWWTGTGDMHSGGRTVVVEKQKDHFRIVLNAMLKNKWTTVWHSDLEPACKIQKNGIIWRDESDSHSQSTGMLELTAGQLELSDLGRLSIAGLCDLYVSPKEREKERSLAVIVAGLYRTNHMTCKTHMTNLIADHSSFARIDVFAYVLFEPADVNVFNRTKESIQAELRECYGSHLRSVDVVPVEEEEEDYPGGQEAMEATPCGKKLRRLNNQLKTVAQAAEKWWAWSIANGFIHDTVLRIRPDTSLRAKPEFKSLEALGQNTLVLPHPHGEHYFYCARMCGRVSVGPTDQIAYGSAAAMGHWLYMYDRFHQMVELAASPSGPALHDFSGCEVLPPSPLASDCPKPAPCSIECLVAWFLDARGLDFHVEWGWEQNLLRWIDLGPLGAEEERLADHDGDDDVDDGLAWG
ncbi:uncharacterized protein ColSpa_02605 [Colletotrichum spaethianum]|uniref:Bulb-type lectin domain-containing protein n=1 Tax=Colletotrichum spaethianum TaxID=700344 RepID=A0AA37P774_9PEZI|nr:uncharacterized protein ColSpa_02605 [Colletotrichum spaethianum]GKT42424.1 hypothetical protein ColSpa_02605 [Colletotrichum spaethianum]